MEDKIKSKINSADIMIFLIPKNDYPQTIMKISKAAGAAFVKTCYVSMNKPFAVMAKEFEKNGVDKKKFIFIDCVGRDLGGGEGVISVTSSTLLIYEETSTVVKFSHSIISAMRSNGTKLIFTCLKDDAQTELIKDLSMFVDSITEL
jgi:hypothetical protein